MEGLLLARNTHLELLSVRIKVYFVQPLTFWNLFASLTNITLIQLPYRNKTTRQKMGSTPQICLLRPNLGLGKWSGPTPLVLSMGSAPVGGDILSSNNWEWNFPFLTHLPGTLQFHLCQALQVSTLTGQTPFWTPNFGICPSWHRVSLLFLGASPGSWFPHLFGALNHAHFFLRGCWTLWNSRGQLRPRTVYSRATVEHISLC